MFGCRYPTHKTCRVQQKLRPSRTPTHWSLTKREPTLWRIRLMTCDRHFFWFLQRICRHRKNRRHRNAGNTEYIHVKDRFWQKMFADVNVLLFPAPVSEGADEAGWWYQGCEWGLQVGFVRSLFWIFPLPRFSWIELTPYMCRVLFGSWLALRMPLQCPFSKPSGAESQVFKKESGPELYIYI